MKLALIFPGQGSQRIGMGAELAAEHSAAKRCFDEASDVLGYDMLALCAGGPAERLRLTEYTQPALLTVSVAAYRCVTERAVIDPVSAAGHSLGEYSALVAAGALDFADGLRLVALRGRAMQAAVPVGEGNMVAVLGLDEAAVSSVCAEVAADGRTVAAANVNAPGQVVISGFADAVDRAAALLKERGAKRILPLDVSAPFHCGLMAPAAETLRGALEEVEFQRPNFTVLANLDAEPYTGAPEDARRRLAAQVCATVQWERCIARMAKDGVTHTLECGPGKVTTALVKRIAPAIATFSVEKPQDLDLFLTAPEAARMKQ